MAKRVENGKVQIGDDWPGIFIRGDTALMGFAPALEEAIRVSKDQLGVIEVSMLRSLLRILRSADAGNKMPAVKLEKVEAVE